MWGCMRPLCLVSVSPAVDNCQPALLSVWRSSAVCCRKQGIVLLWTVPTATRLLATNKNTLLKYICPFACMLQFLVLYIAVRQEIFLGGDYCKVRLCEGKQTLCNWGIVKQHWGRVKAEDRGQERLQRKWLLRGIYLIYPINVPCWELLFLSGLLMNRRVLGGWDIRWVVLMVAKSTSYNPTLRKNKQTNKPYHYKLSELTNNSHWRKPNANKPRVHSSCCRRILMTLFNNGLAWFMVMTS